MVKHDETISHIKSQYNSFSLGARPFVFHVISFCQSQGVDLGPNIVAYRRSESQGVFCRSEIHPDGTLEMERRTPGKGLNFPKAKHQKSFISSFHRWQR